MSDIESDEDTASPSDGVNESMKNIHAFVEQIAHDAKHLYSKAVSLNQYIECPEMDIWAQTYKLHERSRRWAKKHMVASKCSLWEINKTLIETAKKENRITVDRQVTLSQMESDILDLPTTPVSIWKVLGRLPRFFL